MEVNHDDKVVDIERFNISQEIEDVTLESMQPAEQEVAKRLTTPIVNTYLDTKDIAFERQEYAISSIPFLTTFFRLFFQQKGKSQGTTFSALTCHVIFTLVLF